MPNVSPLRIDKEKTYDLPDRYSISVGAKRLRHFGISFQLHSIGKEADLLLKAA